jgi:FkbH-like protein
MKRTPFSFLGASNLLKKIQPKKQKIKFLSSGSQFQLEIFLKAEAAFRGIDLSIETLPFGTLRQHLISNSLGSDSELILLCPWDFLSRFDWRTGVTPQSLDNPEYLFEIKNIAEKIRTRGLDAIFYLQAPVPPATGSIDSLKRIELEIEAVACDLGAEIISRDVFSLDSYLANGCPISGNSLGKVAQVIARHFFDEEVEPKKIIITDLDNTLWSGILGEDGIGGITAAPEGKGYLHFLYQTMLKRLKNSGVLLAIVSKNDEDNVDEALSLNHLYLHKDDFVSVIASYQAKSLQIKELSKKLNLGLEHFVFIDDNPLEVSEVGQALPAITSILFPKNASGMQSLLESLHRFFPITTVTDEDSNRTHLYRQMASSTETVSGEGYNITEFLRSMDMQMVIYDRSTGERSRAVQLFNKTNQFNINGVRRTDGDVARLLAQGVRLYTGEISDVNGSHGEVLAILIDSKGLVLSYVMSCRIFQRQAEFAFLGALTTLGISHLEIDYLKTERNEPVRLFLLKLFPSSSIGHWNLESERLVSLLHDEGSLFKIIPKVKL